MMIEVLQEVTDWSEYSVHNGIYHLNSEGKLVAYQQDTDSEVQKFTVPKQFSKTRRKFVKLSEYPEQEDINAKVVVGSSGNKYVIKDGKCSCSGFRFRGTCKHINSM